jgi:3-(3-hydroxy-phenyl)propionate hydroxylase
MSMSTDSRTLQQRTPNVHNATSRMPTDYQNLRFSYQRPPDFGQSPAAHYPVVVVGAGPVGLVTAIDLARQGLKVVLLDDDDCLSGGSRALCYAKRTLEVLDRLGCGDRVVEKGVSWNVGKVFFRDDPVYQFNLLPEEGHHRPAFVNLQQYYLEGYLHECASSYPNLDIRWKSKVTQMDNGDAKASVTVTTPEGDYTLSADYVIAADGARSPVRNMLNLESKGRVFQDRFLIADVKMKAPFPAERWFWFDPPFHPNQSVLLHREADDVWRIDFQLGWDADPELEKTPERVIPRVRALLGDDVEFDLEWVSVYTFACMRMEKFRHGRVIFAGDAAHGVSPFGARGANSGVQDADNLGWKLGLVLRGEAPVTLLDTYAVEREYAADENILNSTRATDFITPKSAISRVFRDAVLSLSKHHAFAQKLVNSGRLSMPSTYLNSPLNTADTDNFAGLMRPGAPAADAPVLTAHGGRQWFLQQVGDRFTTVFFTDVYSPAAELSQAPVMQVLPAGASTPSHANAIVDVDGLLAARFDARPGTTYLLRPDQHVAARWREFDPTRVKAAWSRSTGQELKL